MVQLHRARVRAERPAHRRHGGQVKIGRDRRETHQRAEDSEHAPAVAHRRARTDGHGDLGRIAGERVGGERGGGIGGNGPDLPVLRSPGEH